MYSHPNSSYPRNPWVYQYPPSTHSLFLQRPPSHSRTTSKASNAPHNGLVTLLSEERTTAESTTREHKQQLSNLTLSQNFLIFMPDVEQKFSALESSIRTNCSNPDNAELQARLKDMLEVVANLGRMAEGFACSTGLRLVPVRSDDRNFPT